MIQLSLILIVEMERTSNGSSHSSPKKLCEETVRKRQDPLAGQCCWTVGQRGQWLCGTSIGIDQHHICIQRQIFIIL